MSLQKCSVPGVFRNPRLMCYSAGMRSKWPFALGAIAILGCSSGKGFEDPNPMNDPDSGGMPGEDGGTTNDDSGSMPGSDSGNPTKDGGVGVDSGDGFDQFQHRNLDDINMYRATLAIAPLALDQQISAFALAGSQQLSQDHSPHAHFIAAGNNGTLWTSGFKSMAGENQGDPNGWTVLNQNPVTNELMQIDAIQKAMFAEGPGTGQAHGHYMNMMNAKFKRVGIGLLEVNNKLYLTNDFSD